MFKAIKKIFFIFCLLIAVFTVAHFALALDAGLSYGAGTGLSVVDPRIMAANIIRIALGFLGIIAVCLIIYAGFLWMTAGGEAEKVEKAKKILTEAVIGLIIILSAFAIASFILNALIGATTNPNDTCATTCTGVNQHCCGSACVPITTSCNDVIIGGGDSFGISSTYPRNLDTGVARNVEIKAFLNKDLDDSTTQSTLDNNFKVERIEKEINGTIAQINEPIVGGVASSSRMISFTSSAACGDEKNTPNCLSEWSKYRVTINGGANPLNGLNGLFSIDDKRLVCTGSNCIFEFSTSNLIDTSGPQSGIVSTQMCKAETGILMKTDANTVTGWGRDDVGISELGFYQKRYGTVPDYLDANLPNPVPGLGETYQTADHKYETKDMTVGNKYDFSVYTYDVANHLASSSFSTIISPGHCCNGIRDMGETEIDCGRDAGCGACDGEACADNMTAPAATCNSNLCASQFCTAQSSDTAQCAAAGYANGINSCCICRRQPVITGIFPVGGFCVNNIHEACLADNDCPSSTCDKTKPNGVAGNFVTIVGRNFGERPSAISPSPSSSPSPDPSADSGVFFSSGRAAGPWVKAELADGVGGNSRCANNVWSDEQIIAIVPPGARNGPIKVVTVAGFSDDSTANPEIENFVLNSIARPGICQIENVKCAGQSDAVCKKDHGLLNDTINYYGIKLLGVSSYLGNLDNKISGVKEGDFNDKNGKAKVPNIVAGKTSTFVLKADGKVYSNYLNFTKEAELYKGPFISSFDPKEGATGQYVTIHGGGFGATKGASEVYFGDEGGTKASYTFPGICADSIWSDKQVIVKVPPIVEGSSGFVNGNYKITMKIGTWPAINTTTIRPAVVFKVDSTLPLAPSLCKIEPTIGKVNSQVSLYGEYFGAKAIPYVKIGDKSYPSIRFQVNKDQAEGEIGFWGKKVDADMATTTVPDQAVTGPVKIVQAHTFLTQPSPRELIGNGLNFTVGICKTADDCGANSLCCSAGTPYASQCKNIVQGKTTEQDLCFPEIKSCVYEWRFDTNNIFPRVGDPCDKDATTPKCDKDDAVCQPSGLVCDPTSCVCKQPCNNNLTDDSCSPNNNKCLATPTTPVCNTDTCLCEECVTAADCEDGEVCSPTHTCEPAVESCSGYGNQCANAGFCPNSYGQCSVHPAGELVSCACDEAFPLLCKDGGCQYNSTFKRCLVLYGSGNQLVACDPSPRTYTGVDNKDVEARCVNNRWQIDTALSCLVNWTNIGGNRCVQDGTTCSVCSGGFKCLTHGEGSGTENYCAVDKEVCPADSTCDSNKKCTNSGNDAGCECCCRKANSNQDCCAPLECKGECGSDTGNPSPATFGLCTGCTVNNVDPLLKQSESNKVCNCPGSSGKFCDTSVASGVCRDCAQLSDAQSCSGLGAGTCCVDAKNSNACRINTAYDASKNPIYATDDANPTYNYCAYYSCDIVNQANQCLTTPKKTGDYRTDNCDGKCLQGEGEACYDGGKPGACVEANSQCDTAKNLICDIPSCTCKNNTPQFGQNCVSYTSVQPSCDATKCNNFSCLTDLGASPLTPPCGVCCCDPSPGNDKCATSLNPKLKCQADRGTCTGAGRGLCCGCSKDSECGDTINTGCGSDACCQARPTVTGNEPTGTNVCRNTLISATFSQPMQINTFVGNVIVVGEYGTGQCPAGTEYLAAVYKPTVFARIKSWLAGLPVINKLLITDFIVEAQAEPSSSPSSSPSPQPLSKNYCAVAGSASGYNKGTQTVLEFKLQKLLDPGRKYYVIIKGDSDITDAINNGVLSQTGIGMNPANSSTFNGVTYKGKIWSFTTRNDSDANKGICEIASVEIDPSSHLFQTNIDNVSDNTAGDKFNTIDDSDLVYRAIARAADGTALNSLAGVYSWTWGWVSGSIGVFDFIKPTPPSTLAYNENLLQARPTVTAGESVITAKATMIAGGGGPYSATANAYLMVCANPWPTVKSDGKGGFTWAPWQENGLKCSDGSGSCAGKAAEDICDDRTGTCQKNCTVQTANCDSTNYELSYCRDAGGPGTADDLPAIFSDNAVISGANLRCSDGKSSCGTIKDAHCGDSAICNSSLECSDNKGSCAEKKANDYCGPTCEVDILKELYFFREGLPSTSGTFKVTALARGGTVSATWDKVTATPVTGYKIYYGVTKGSYTGSVDVAAELTATPITQTKEISGLTNGRPYYFALTSYNAQKAESVYTVFQNASVTPPDSVTPRDTVGPAAPIIVSTTAKDARVELKFNDNDKEAVTFKIFYKAEALSTDCKPSVKFGSSVQAKNNATTTVNSLANGVRYCFGAVAYDLSGNPATSTISVIPFAPVTNLSLVSAINGTVKLSWGAAQGAVRYKVYYNKTGDSIINFVDAPAARTVANSLIISGLVSGTTYDFVVRSFNADGRESVNSNEISAKPLALAVPQGLWSTADATGITIKWTASTTDDSVSYKVYYGASKDSTGKPIYGASVSLAKSKCLAGACAVKISGLNLGLTYYFSITALDAQSPPNESVKASEISFDMTKITNQASIDLANCQANLQQINSAIIAKRIETNKYLIEITENKWSADACNNSDLTSVNSITSTGCHDRMLDVFQRLGFSGLLVDPWSHPYFIDENQGENTSPDYIYSSTPPGCGYTSVDLFTKNL